MIEGAEAGIAKAEKERATDQTLSLDPTAARQAIADATFGANRLRMLLAKLQACYQQLQYQDQVTAWHADADVRQCERDALPKNCGQLFLAEIVDLFGRIIANDKALSELHLARPAGVSRHLLSAELHARGLDGYTRDMPSLLTSVHLTDLESGRQIWPPPQPSMAAAFAAMNMRGPDLHRFTSDWAKDNDRRAEAQRAEQQRMANYYASLNAESWERHAASQRKMQGGGRLTE